MKILKFTIAVFILCLIVCPLYQCKKETIKMSLGTTQKGLKPDTIYKANTDGFLIVQLNSSSIGPDNQVTIYSDTSKNPITLVSQMAVTGETTIPIQKNNYWKVIVISTLRSSAVTILWTPMQ